MWPKVVFFDVGNTLIYPRRSVGEVYASAMRGEGLDCTPARAEEAFRQAWALQRSRAGSQRPAYGSTDVEARRWWRRVVLLSVESFGEVRDFDRLFEKLWHYFARPEAWGVYADVRPVLGRLAREGVCRALISNWDSRLIGLLKGLGLWDCFESRTISCRTGYEKPHPAIFEAALSSVSAVPADTIHVGDCYEEDIIGARQAGMKAIWLVREGGTDRTALDCEKISRLDQLFRRLPPEGSGR